MINNCKICDELEQDDTLCIPHSYHDGIGYEYIRGVRYCPLCGKPLLHYKEKEKIRQDENKKDK